MKLAVLMSPLHQLTPYKDTTIAMIKRAKAMGWSCVYFTQTDLFCFDGQAVATVYDIDIGDEHSDDWATVTSLGQKKLAEFDIILMRQDPPFDLEYIYATYALECAECEGVLVANKPQSVRDANEKMVTITVPQCCPPTLVSRSIQELKTFWHEQEHVIFKPLDGMGGSSIFEVGQDGKNLSVILEVLTHQESRTIMAQRYIPDIRHTGDKRILLINGEPVPFGLARIPAQGELRGNLAAGATGQVVAITERDRWICSQIGPMLRAKGLYFVGIDVIGDYLTEINVTSPTCLREIEAETGLDIAGEYLACLGEYLRA